MKKVKLDDATNAQLDWLVEFTLLAGRVPNPEQRASIASRNARRREVSFATDYGLIGKLCHERGVSVTNPHHGSWWATLGDPTDDTVEGMFDGTPQRAACKALLLSRADEQGFIDVPEELL